MLGQWGSLQVGHRSCHSGGWDWKEGGTGLAGVEDGLGLGSSLGGSQG